MPPMLVTRGLSKSFGGVVATDDVSLEIPQGELRCIIGPNGAGKTTLFALLCGLQRPDAGQILFKGTDATRLPPFRRVRLGMGLTFQTNRAFHNLTVRQNLEAPMRVVRADASSDADRRFGFALEKFGLDPTSSQLARHLPHHRLQWLEIAMALAAGPDVLLLDEPTAGMSSVETTATAAVLQHLNNSGLTIIVIEHDIAFVREVAQTVTVLHQGKVFAEGTVDSITAHQEVRKIYLGQA
jgi:branched-chain amino acid transport system ATP-binding protein